MKKLLIGLCFLCASTPSMAAGANKMTMVTYFPVKYVAYSQVDVMKQMDVGLTSACQMNLGCSADEGFNTGKSLRVNNLLKIAGGKLELNDAPAIEGSTARIGSGNGTADFDFKTSLRVGNYKQGYTLQADNMYLNELNLFGYKFPKCEGETMSWQKLKLKNKEEVYLVCGEAEQGTCEPPADEPTSEPCGEGMTGTKTRTWNYEVCQWNFWIMSGCRFNTGNSDCDPCGPGMHQAKGLTCNYCCCEYDGAGTDLSKPIRCKPKAGLIDPGVGGSGGVIGGNHNSGFTGPIGGDKGDPSK
ncbi:hypothetical protein [Candidatus Avelusimicrobium fimicolum]|uniref:hypothetical protein n=1 Tax=Candidatus Avelusimicrobium fimicolum TaxID=3416216 RepID=UPI003D0DE8D2